MRARSTAPLICTGIYMESVRRGRASPLSSSLTLRSSSRAVATRLMSGCSQLRPPLRLMGTKPSATSSPRRTATASGTTQGGRRNWCVVPPLPGSTRSPSSLALFSCQSRHRRKPSMPGVRPRLSTALRLVRFACVFVLLVVLVTAGAVGRVGLPRPLSPSHKS